MEMDMIKKICGFTADEPKADVKLLYGEVRDLLKEYILHGEKTIQDGIFYSHLMVESIINEVLKETINEVPIRGGDVNEKDPAKDF